MNKILVFAEQREGEVKKSTFESITLAQNLATSAGVQFVSVLIGTNLNALENELAKYGAIDIYKYTDEKFSHYNSEGYAKVLEDAVKESGADVVLMAATAMGKDLAPRLGARLNAVCRYRLHLGYMG